MDFEAKPRDADFGMGLTPETDRANGGMAMVYDPDFHDLPEKRPEKFRAKAAPMPPVALWSWVYVANLPFPAFMGAWLSYGWGLLGMAAGVALLHEAGRRACHVYPWAVQTVSRGGVVVAFCQFFPIPQLLAGAAGVGAACFLLQWDSAATLRLDPATALLATIFTGLILIACAGVLGLIGRTITYLVQWLSPTPREDEWHEH